MWSALIAVGSVALFGFLAFVCVGLIIADPVGGGIFLALCFLLLIGMVRAVGKNERDQMDEGDPKC